MRQTILIFLLSALAFNVSAQSSYSMRNPDGGESFYQGGRFIGYTAPNVHGGRDFYPSMSTRMQGYGYHSHGSTHLQDGAAIGWGLSNLINAFKGGGQ